MTFKIDYRDGDVHRWSLTDDGVECAVDTDYTPTCYVAAHGADASLAEAESHLDSHPGVAATDVERWRTVWRHDPEPVLRVDATTLESLTDVAHGVRGWGDPGAYRLFNVDLAREFRYCLERGVDPTPPTDRTPSTLELRLSPKALNDGDIAGLTVDGEAAGDTEGEVLDAVAAVLAARDPEVLVVSAGDLVPLLYRKAREHDRAGFELGRRPGWERLAAESTYESYGRVGHSPARYNVAGRAIVDVSNSFFWRQTNVSGLLDLVERARKPLQETAWASIGNVLTSIQIRVATDRGVLVPWNSWRHERFKPMTTLQAADRGGFIFSPDVGLHEAVHELDFASLYPNIMITRNVSPDVIRCDCHADREDVPGLGYGICDDDGYIREVLEPIVTDRERYKERIDATDDAERAAALGGRASALKWILVSCFGYQGFSNAKFGRIECHEAINAVAREILLDAKATLEGHGWRVVHGIVDSLWVQAMPDREQTPLEAVAREVTDEVGITLEYEGAFDWIAFVPRKDSEEGALNRYFGKRADGDGFKQRGIELRQRSTPPFVEDCQATWLETLDEARAPEPVCDRLAVQLADLRAGDVDPDALHIRRRVSQDLAEYGRYTRNAAALERAAVQEFTVPPGEDVEYVVVDDDKRSAARVRLAHEDVDRHDAAFYADLLVRAAESVVSPLGWDRARIRRYLADTEDAAITAY